MSRNRRIVLHAGLPKTGTTSIQAAFYEQRRLLLQEARLLYPSLAANLTNALCTLFHDDPRKHITNKLAGITTRDSITELQSEYRGALEREISSTDWDTLLLSAEGVSNLHSQELRDLRGWGDQFANHWTALFCVRHPVDFVRSHVQELLKGGLTLEQLYDNLPSPAFRGKIMNLINNFGRENVIIFDFETAKESRGGVIGAFAARVGLPAPICDILSSRDIRENPSLSHEAILLLDSVNRQRPMFQGARRAPRRSDMDLHYISRIRGGRFDIPPEMKHKVQELTRGDIEWMNGEFGLSLYHDIIESRATEERPSQFDRALSKDAIDDIASVIAELTTENAFLHSLEGGRAALSQGDLSKARERFLEAERLDPEASQPKQWLTRLTKDQR